MAQAAGNVGQGSCRLAGRRHGCPAPRLTNHEEVRRVRADLPDVRGGVGTDLPVTGGPTLPPHQVKVLRSDRVSEDVFIAPDVHVGQTVQWFPGPGHKPVAAIVTQVGDGGICHLWLFDRYQPGRREAVRHAGDPMTHNEGYMDRHAGEWRHIPRSNANQKGEVQ